MKRGVKNRIISYKDYCSLLIASTKHGTQEVLIDNNKIEIIDQYKWRVMKKSGLLYAIAHTPMLNKKRKTIQMHRLVTDFKFKFVDHINRNTLDNRRINLRDCNASENHGNAIHKGCYFVKRVNKWMARINKDGKTIYLGYFTEEEKAIEAYRKAHLELFKEFSPYGK